MSDKYRHMEEAWGIEENPFPSEAIHQGSEPYNPQVCPDDHDGLREAILAARRRLGATLVALREEALDAFVTGDDGSFAEWLSEVSDASRIRSGLAYFDFAFTIASAAGVPHFFVFVDQLE